jgi:hypothetical protein
MTTTTTETIRSSRVRIPRTRGALGGGLLLVLGAWAGLVAFIGPYFDFAFTPDPDDAWHWTAARGYLEVIPAAAVFVGGLLLIVSASRVTTSLGGWLAVAGGAWLVVGPPLAPVLTIDLGQPDPTSGTGVRALEALFFFYGIGAAIVFVASLALGRLSVRSLRDVQAAERRLAADAAAAPVARAEEPTSAGATDAPVTTGSPDDGTSVRHRAPGDEQVPAAAPPVTDQVQEPPPGYRV